MSNLNLRDCPRTCPYFVTCGCETEDENKCECKEWSNNHDYFSKVDFINQLLKEYLLDHFVTYPDKNSVVCFAVQNVYLSEACVMTSLVGADTFHAVKNFATFVEDLKQIEEKTAYDVLIVDGGHGAESGDDALNDPDLADESLYTDACKIIGLKPYPSNLNQTGNNIKKEDYLQFLSKGQEREEIPNKRNLLCHNYFKDWKFTVVNIAQFMQSKEEFRRWVKERDPAIVVIAWCHSVNGTTANVLAPHFSRIILGYDRVCILGGQMKLVELGENQREVLDDFEKRLLDDNTTKRRHVVLTGLYGSGKTLFGAQFVRMLLAKKRLIYRNKDKGDFKIVIVDYSASNARTSPLSEMIKGYFETEIEKNDVEVDLSLQQELFEHFKRKGSQGLCSFLEKLNFSHEADKVIVFIDEIHSEFDFKSINFENLTSINFIGCVNPMHPKHPGKFTVYKQPEAVLYCHLTHTYRNNLAIQNIFNKFTKDKLGLKTSVTMEEINMLGELDMSNLSMKADPGFQEQNRHESNTDVSLIVVGISDSDRKNDHKISIVTKLLKGILCNINKEKKQLSWPFGKKASLVDEFPNKQMIFILCTSFDCKLCQKLGKTFGLDVIYIYFDKSHRGLEKNTVILHHSYSDFNCFEEISRATHHLILIYKLEKRSKERISIPELISRNEKSNVGTKGIFIDMQNILEYDEEDNFEDLMRLYSIEKLFFSFIKFTRSIANISSSESDNDSDDSIVLSE